MFLDDDDGLLQISSGAHPASAQVAEMQGQQMLIVDRAVVHGRFLSRFLHFLRHFVLNINHAAPPRYTYYRWRLH